MKNEFEQWLQNNSKLKESSIEEYVMAIDSISKEFNITLYETIDFTKYCKIESEIVKNDKFKKANNTRHRKWKSALKYYGKFLGSKDNDDVLNAVIKNYVRQNSPKVYEKSIEKTLEVRKEFVSLFDIKKIEHMTLDEYVTGRSTIDEKGKQSFCYIIETQLKNLGEMRGPTVKKFGVWYSNDNKYKYTKRFGNNINDAFGNVKKELIKLIKAADINDYDTIDDSRLSPLYREKILSTYFPEKYLCIFNESNVELFLLKLGINYDPKKTNGFEKRQLLKNFKNNNYILRKCSDYYFVGFLYNTYRKDLKHKHLAYGKNDNNVSLVKFDLIGSHDIPNGKTDSSNNTNYIVKAKRNKKIGDFGEKKVIKFEKDRLKKLGFYEKAKQVEKTKSDSIGYDVLSFDDNGDEIHIEVKTSSSNKAMLSFFLTCNELEHLKTDKRYCIYYVYGIKNNLKICIINKRGQLKKIVKYLKPIIYRATIDIKVTNVNK